MGVLVPLPPPPLPVQDMLLPMVKRQTGYQRVVEMDIESTKDKRIFSKFQCRFLPKVFAMRG